jgi:hypothetical protein
MQFRRGTVGGSKVIAFWSIVNWAGLKKNGYPDVWPVEKVGKAEDQTNQRLLFVRLNVNLGTSFAKKKKKLSQSGLRRPHAMCRWRTKESRASFE